MQITLIVGRIADSYSAPVLTVAGAWDDYCLDGNREGYNADLDQAVADYGYRNVREVTFTISDETARASFDAPRPDISGDLVLIWRIEDGELELVDGWDTDTISENPDGFDEAVREDYAITCHYLDWDQLGAAFAPPAVSVTAA